LAKRPSRTRHTVAGPTRALHPAHRSPHLAQQVSPAAQRASHPAEDEVIRIHWFRLFAERVARALGSPWAFLVAVAAVLIWAIAGPFFGFSAGWQMVINTGTTILTFLMVFLLQNTQIRDSTALHIKLNELLRAVQEARTELVEVESMPDEKIQELSHEFSELVSHENGGEHHAPIGLTAPNPGTKDAHGSHNPKPPAKGKGV
jgi:low affinity Fe/Cu permease